MTIDWENAPTGFDVWIEDIRPDIEGDNRSGWARLGKGEYEFPGGGWWSCSHENKTYRAHKKPDDSQWVGEGLPPVGTVCEYSVNGGPWYRCEIKYTYHDDENQFAIINCPHLRYEQQVRHDLPGNCDGVMFRQIRTAEQIASDERLHEVRNALSAIHAGQQQFPSDLVRGNIVAATVEAMIDAGYRKQVTP